MTDYGRIDVEPERSRPFLRSLIIILIAFLAGLAAMGWIVTRWDAAAPYLTWLRPPVATAVHPAPLPQPVVAPALPPAAVLDGKLAELENRIDHIAQRAEAASGDADHAEGLLVAFAARRAIDRGAPLGYVEGLLQERFGQTQPQAVMTIITAARQPITLEELESGLESVAPSLVGESPQTSWWDGFRQELAGLIVVRRADTPSTAPVDRLNRARRELEAGHADRALAEVARMPGRDAANDWIAKARRYIAAHNALDLVETAALLDPAHRPVAPVRLAPAKPAGQPG